MACTITFSANAQSCVNIGGISSLKIGSTSVDTRPETSHAEFKYTYNNDTGVGFWEGDIYMDLGRVDATNIASVNSLAQAGTATVVATLANGSVWTIADAYCTSANAGTGTKAEDGSKVDATMHVKCATCPVPTTT